MVHAFGAGQVDVPLVHAGAFDDRRELLQHRPNLGALAPTFLERNGNADGIGAEPQRAGDRHGGADAELARLIGSGADDTTALARAADNQEGRFARALGVDCAGDCDIKCVSVCQQNPAHGLSD
jgi:hypothetical protein